MSNVDIILGVVCGLKTEARAFRRGMQTWPRNSSIKAGQCRIRCAGGRAQEAEKQARALIEDGARALCSFGFAGALAPDLSPGDILVPMGVKTIDPKIWYETDLDWQTDIRIALKQAGFDYGHGAPLFGSDSALLTPLEKQTARRLTQADSVDMESHAVAKVAFQHNVPFLILRVVSDSTDVAIPASAMRAVQPSGSINIFTILLDLIKNPGNFAAYRHLGQSAKLAEKQLVSAIASCPGLLFKKGQPVAVAPL